MIITLISDTHTKQRYIDRNKSGVNPLPGGDLLIHAGDIMNSGYDPVDIEDFIDWFSSQTQYAAQVFIAGNHDRMFEDKPELVAEIVDKGDSIYLQDEPFLFFYNDFEAIKVYGSPWQPEFYDWAFNLPRNGVDLASKWEQIPLNTDILITHGPPMGYGDTSGPPYNEPNLGCELLRKRVDFIKPKIHMFGHIHGGYGYYFNGDTHFINASILNEEYRYTNEPITIDWNPKTNKLKFI